MTTKGCRACLGLGLCLVFGSLSGDEPVSLQKCFWGWWLWVRSTCSERARWGPRAQLWQGHLKRWDMLHGLEGGQMMFPFYSVCPHSGPAQTQVCVL